MKTKSFEMDAAMLSRKFYCHQCGEKLIRNPEKRIIRRGDPDYRRYRHVGRVITFGDVELTEYNFCCPACNRIIDPDEQYIIEYIQKKVGEHRLTQAQIDAMQFKAQASIKRKGQIGGFLFAAIIIVIALVVFYFKELA